MNGYYDDAEDMIPTLIRNSRWRCLDCLEPSGEPWESTTDHCPAAHDHHYATGHRVNGTVEVRYRAQNVEDVIS